MGSFSIWHWLIVLVIVMLVFGTKRLRNIGGDLGGAIKDFKEGLREGGTDANPPANLPPAQPTNGRTIDVETQREQHKG